MNNIFMNDWNWFAVHDGDPDCDHNPQHPDGGKARVGRFTPLGRGGM